MKHFTVWIWPDNRNPELEEKVRDALCSRGFEWDEKIEECMSAPITVECPAMEFGIDESHTVEDFVKWLDEFTLSDGGELLYHNMTMDETEAKIMESHGLPKEGLQTYNDDKAEDAFIEECKDSYDK